MKEVITAIQIECPTATPEMIVAQADAIRIVILAQFEAKLKEFMIRSLTLVDVEKESLNDIIMRGLLNDISMSKINKTDKFSKIVADTMEPCITNLMTGNYYMDDMIM